MTPSFAKLIPLILVGTASVFSQSTPTWQQLFPATSPPARYAYALAYDSARNQMVLFGGIGTAGGLNDTWTWDGTNWTQRSPANSPYDSGLAMAYDSARQETVLYNGSTWVWDGTNWSQRFPTNSPRPRFFMAMVYDAARQQMVLFGGQSSPFDALNDTWVWDGHNWTQKLPAISPRARGNYAMAYDAARQQTVLFGGLGLDPPHNPCGCGSPVGVLLNDTWVWDGNNWTQKFPANSPPTGEYSAAAYDSSRQQAVLFGGSGSFGTPFQDTWVWDGTNWTRQMPTNQPYGRSGASLAYDTLHQQLLLFGGDLVNQSPAAAVSDTWVYPARFNSQLTFNATPNPSLFGQPVTLTATVNSLATGTVTFYNGVTILGTASVIGGVVSLTSVTLPPGTLSLRAYYSGDATFPPASLTGSERVTTVPASQWVPSTGSPMAVGPGPFAAVAADFNGDHNVDLAVINSAAGKVTVFLGDGKGGFAPVAHGPFSVGLGPFALAAGDFNGDGRTDLAIANEGDNTVSVLLGDGQGGFAPAPGSPLASVPSPISLVVADFNSDGKADLAVASGTENTAQIFRGNGDGSFTPATGTIELMAPATYIFAADFDLNGIPDLGVAETSGDFEQLLGTTSGTLINRFNEEIGLTYSSAAGDFDGDGIADFALAYLDGNEVQVWLGTGYDVGTVQGPIPVGSSPESVATGDFNGDGNLDLVVANSDSNNVTMLLGDGAGVFAPAFASPLPAGNAPFCVVVADFNGDGRADLAIVNFIDGTISILLGAQ